MFLSIEELVDQAKAYSSVAELMCYTDCWKCGGCSWCVNGCPRSAWFVT